MTIEERLTNLENLVYALIKRVDNDKFYNEADKSGIRQTESQHLEMINDNSNDVSDVRTAIEEVYEMLNEGE